MRRNDVKTIIAYYYGIPAMKKLLNSERAELEDEYNGLRGTSADGMPHGSTSGRLTEEMAERTETQNVWGRLEAINVRQRVLDADRETIRDCLDALKGEYKHLLTLRYRYKYSWPKIATETIVAERTVKRRHDTALDRLGDVLDDVPMSDELLGRASRARV